MKGCLLCVCVWVWVNAFACVHSLTEADSRTAWWAKNEVQGNCSVLSSRMTGLPWLKLATLGFRHTSIFLSFVFHLSQIFCHSLCLFSSFYLSILFYLSFPLCVLHFNECVYSNSPCVSFPLLCPASSYPAPSIRCCIMKAPLMCSHPLSAILIQYSCPW